VALVTRQPSNKGRDEIHDVEVTDRQQRKDRMVEEELNKSTSNLFHVVARTD
jgi:hypothetical protein